MINHGIAVVGIAILTILSVGCGSSPSYAGPDAEVVYVETDISKYRIGLPEHYWAGRGMKLINTEVELYHDDFSLLQSMMDDHPTFAGLRIYTGKYGEWITFDRKTINEMVPLFDVRLENTKQRPSVVYLSVHPKDPAKPKENLFYRVDRIEGLISIEEAQAIVAREEKANAEQIAAEETRRQAEEVRRQAREEANRYDPTRFIVVPSNFRPANYTKADLFDAVAASEKLEAVSVIPANGYVFNPSKEFVSDVVFVSQNGTDITFRTEDNAIRQTMKVDSRTGLTAGQKVRIYYKAYRVQNWQVFAIERL
jgi:hypothetical protein